MAKRSKNLFTGRYYRTVFKFVTRDGVQYYIYTGGSFVCSRMAASILVGPNLSRKRKKNSAKYAYTEINN